MGSSLSGFDPGADLEEIKEESKLSQQSDGRGVHLHLMQQSSNCLPAKISYNKIDPKLILEEVPKQKPAPKNDGLLSVGDLRKAKALGASAMRFRSIPARPEKPLNFFPPAKQDVVPEEEKEEEKEENAPSVSDDSLQIDQDIDEEENRFSLPPSCSVQKQVVFERTAVLEAHIEVEASPLAAPLRP